MEIKLVKNKIVITHKLKPNETYRVDKRKKYSSVTIFKSPRIVIGVSSRTQDGKDILMLDYDQCDLDLVKSDVLVIQNMFKLAPAYLFTTRSKKQFGKIIGNFHIMILSKHLPKEIVEIQNHTHIDSNYADSPVRNRFKSWVLRIGPKGERNKPRFLEIIGDKNLEQEISTAHKRILKKLYPKIKHPKYLREDGFKKIALQEYETLG